ncbi:MAG: S49 family peptidase [Alphaproteobacteria bacterium]
MAARSGPLVHLAQRALNRAHMIDPRKARAILGVLGPRLGGLAGLSIEAPVAATAPAVATVQAGAPSIAIIEVHGTLVARCGGLDALSGLASYGEVLAQYRAARDDASVRAILLDIDSPGGEVDGCFDLADEIAAGRGGKPCWAVSNHAAYSAAYAIAAACDQVWVSRTGGVGSIGVFYLHCDVSARDRKEGMAWTPIFAGARKLDGWEHAPLSEEAQADAQDDVDEVYDLFVSSVAAWRGMEEDAVRETEARCITGLGGAVDAGLADQVGTIDDALAALAASVTEGAAPTTTRSKDMATRHHALRGTKPGASKPKPKRSPAATRRARAETPDDEDADTMEGAEGGDADTVEGAEGDDADTMEGAEDEAPEDGDGEEEDVPAAESPAARAATAERRRCAGLIDAASVADAPLSAVAKAVKAGQSVGAFVAAQAAAKRAKAGAGQPGPVRNQHGAAGNGTGDNHGWNGAFAKAANVPVPARR